MSWFNKVSDKFNKATGLGKNNDLFKVGAGIMTGGASVIADKAEKGNLTDLLMGKKEGAVKADSIAKMIKKNQTQGLGELNSALDQGGSGNIIREQATREKAGILTAAQDARRNAQKMMAQSGLQNSSLGLGLNRSIDQQSGRDLATVDARMPGLIRDQQLQDAQTRINAGGLASAGNIQHQNIEGQRSGGFLGIASSLAPLVGTVAGASMGGPAGAAIGGQVGSSTGSIFSPTPKANPYSANKYSMGNYKF